MLLSVAQEFGNISIRVILQEPVTLATIHLWGREGTESFTSITISLLDPEQASLLLNNGYLVLISYFLHL